MRRNCGEGGGESLSVLSGEARRRRLLAGRERMRGVTAAGRF